MACEICTNKELEKSNNGTYNEDEKLKNVTFAGTHGQCDLCLEQCEDYPDCEGNH